MKRKLTALLLAVWLLVGIAQPKALSLIHI